MAVCTGHAVARVDALRPGLEVDADAQAGRGGLQVAFALFNKRAHK